ncbi:alpha-1,3-mannosyl-glycoprotein 2-beta-N-acetylglucosaminyltransferase isoform X2 [Gossypium arboreum]|uniref:alpha-1,3-mannosyl-glycoprotein 2-beta-N-acetylglucosaminyltransferase isoform X2 n=1 Tax=Gossypium arboreum TaxID=29729 RepID=UPI0022F19F1A|nr:alpha-1,3-mannosyl-glycoprotein 2-beta-N-acetylglucosaminyltransferase isoform X2 [Gossypium arboreum]
MAKMRLFTTQSEYADRMAEAVDAEHHCTSQIRLLIDQISMQQEQIVALEEGKKRKDQECAQLKTLVNDLEKKALQRVIDKTKVPVAAVVIMACNRADYLERTVASVLKYQSSVASKYPLFVSQDGSDPRVKTKALSYKELTYMQHIDYDPVHTDRPGELIAYYKIARHYKWALDELFYKHNFDRVIILEDDMEIAPDFFDYFEAAAALLDKDKSIMAVSSWNDNGQKQFVYDPYALYRSDFFPGLGWMLTRSVWNELSPKWPKAYWDDWLRLKDNHNGRQFLRPEVCRTYNFGEHGSSMGQFFEKYLAPIKMNDVKVDWKSQDLSYLTEEKYAQYFADILKAAKPVPGTDPALMASNIEGDIRIQYRDQSDFEYIAQQFGVFEEWKDGVPRTAYKGVVVFRYHPPRRVFLVGPDSLQQLGIENA